MLWHTTSLGWGLTDPSEVLAQASENATQREYSELQVAWGIFAMAATVPSPPLIGPSAGRSCATAPALTSETNPDDKKSPARIAPAGASSQCI